jgi:outer membrane protein TolC
VLRVTGPVATVVALATILATAAGHAGPGAAPPVAARESSGGMTGASLVAIADALVQESLAQNLDLVARDATVTARLAALDQARARWLPVVDFEARYSRADGGRVIPIHGALNTLLAREGLPAPFQAIGNSDEPLLRSREQQTTLTLAQPLYDARIPAAAHAAAAQHGAAVADLDAFRSRLARDVRQAYYRWLRAGENVKILEATLELARSNLRVNESLRRNGKITPDQVYRAEADVLEVEQSLLTARNSRELARSYVNLLRDRPLRDALPEARVSDADVAMLQSRALRNASLAAIEPDGLVATALARRAELRGLSEVARAAAAAEDLARAAFRPRLGLAVEGGTQGTGYGLGDEERYVIASVVLRFNLWNGGADRAAVGEARARAREADAAHRLAANRIELEVQQAAQDLQVALASAETAAKRVQAAEGAFRIAAKKRDLGQVTQTEYIDARRARTDAELNLNVTRFDALGSIAELEYALGLAARDTQSEEAT